MMQRINRFKFVFGMSLGLAVGLSSCDLQEQITLTADAGSDVTVNVGETVSLDGSGSSGVQGTMVYLWVIDSKPSGSQVFISDPATVNPSFTPDMEGDYVVKLTVSNGVSDDMDQVTVTAVSGGSGINPVEVSGQVSSDETWTDHIEDPATPDYHLTGDTYLNAELTIEPGVLIHADEDVVLDVTENGALMAAGEAGNRIVMTSSNATGGQLWKGVRIASTDARNELSYVDISHAGNSEFGGFADFVDLQASIAVMEGGVLNLTHSTVSNSGGYGMYVRYGELKSFADNAFTDNTLTAVGVHIAQATMIDGNTTFSGNDYDVEIFGSTLDENDDKTLRRLNGSARYYVTGDLYITSYLDFEAGTYLEMAEDVKIQVEGEGVFVADASGGDRIVFTSAASASGILWKGLSIHSADVRNTLNNVELSYAGNSEFGGFADFVDLPVNLAVMEGGKISVINSEVSNSGGYGMYVRFGDIENFSSNTFADNADHAVGLEANQAKMIDENTTFSGNGWDGVEVFGSYLTEESTWVSLQGNATYRLTGNVEVNSGLNLDPGVSIMVDEDYFFKVFDAGYFSALGTSGDMITLSSSNEAGQIHWGGIWFETADARNALDHVHVNYAGGASMDLDNFQDPFTAVGGDEGAEVTITNSTIENSDGSGVYWQGAGTINDIESGSANNSFIGNSTGNTYTP